MYKIMIVDDEPLIREGLKELIPWIDYGFCVTATAKDGLDALERYDEALPDVMIVDIRMPGMDGLELIGTLRARRQELRFLILSGYADFDYAKKALIWNVDGYMLKPVDEDELIEYLHKIRRELDGSAERKMPSQDDIDKRRETVVHTLIRRSGHMDDKLFAELSAVGMTSKAYQAAMLAVEHNDGQGLFIQNELKRKLQSTMSAAGTGAVFTLDTYVGVLLMQTYKTESRLAELQKQLNGAMEGLEGELVIAVGEGVYGPSGVQSSVETALRLIKRRFYADATYIINPDSGLLHQPEWPDGQEDDYDYGAVENQLVLSLDFGNRDSVRRIVERIGARMAARGLSEQAIKTNYAQLVTAAASRLQQQNPGLQGVRELLAWVPDMYRQRDLSSLIEFIYERLEIFIGQLELGNVDTLAKKITDIIDRNYMENLKLDALAEVFNYNSAYLGKMFKNHTGQYFNTYLDTVRMEKAKELLQRGLKVYQVAEQVGYANVDYFNSKFKKYVGMPPSVYRGKLAAGKGGDDA